MAEWRAWKAKFQDEIVDMAMRSPCGRGLSIRRVTTALTSKGRKSSAGI